MKKLLFFFSLFLLSYFSYAQLKVHSTGVVEIGSTSTTPTLKKGLEVKGDSVLFKFPGSAKIVFYVGGLVNMRTFSAGFPEIRPNEYPIIKGSYPNTLEIGTTNSYIGKVYANRFYSPNGIQITSDRRAKENISSISSSLESIKMLRPVFYDLKNIPEANMDTVTLKNKVGFIAQEVQEVFPQVVGYMEDIDLYTMDYASLIPFLTKAIQEQQVQIEALQDQIQDLSQGAQYAAPTSGTQSKTPSLNHANQTQSSAEVSVATQLFQNTPNPFSQSTKIAYIVDKKASSAQICVYNLNGTQLKCYQIQPSGAGEIEIKGSELQAGMYIYGMIVNGLLVDSKRMVLTN